MTLLWMIGRVKECIYKEIEIVTQKTARSANSEIVPNLGQFIYSENIIE